MPLKNRLMIRLSVNINKIATLRNARGGNVPDVLKVAVDCQKFGAQGITVHPRPDERHIRYSDVRQLRKLVSTEFNIEGYPSRDFMDLVCSVVPEQVTLVPDPPDALTSNAGWDTVANEGFLKEVIAEFRSKGIRTSIFVGTDLKLVAHAARCGTHRVELYTEPYALEYPENAARALAPFAQAARVAHENGLGINAGHDLNLLNLRYFAQGIPHLDEVSIGHALISDALYFGLENVVQMYLDCLR